MTLAPEEIGPLSRVALPGEEALEARLRPATLDEMVGQDRLRENLAVFIRAAPGVGSKMAERILVELRDRTGELAASLSSTGEFEPPSEGDGPSTASLGLALSALLNLGYSKQQADLALTRAAGEEGDDPTLEGLVRGSLRMLMK